jgi:hypothetical protein
LAGAKSVFQNNGNNGGAGGACGSGDTSQRDELLAKVRAPKQTQLERERLRRASSELDIVKLNEDSLPLSPQL